MKWDKAEYRNRPQELDLNIVDEIIAQVENGELLDDICSDIDYPLPGTFLRWCRDDPSIMKRYEDARSIGTDVRFDRAVSTASSGRQGCEQASRSMMWHVERSNPEKYGRSGQPANKEKPKEGGGTDYASGVRARIETMHKRIASEAREATKGHESQKSGG